MENKEDGELINISGVSEEILETIDAEELKEYNEKLPLQQRKIAISISESEDLESLGMSELHLKDSIIEFARHILVQGGTIVYGGDLRKEGFTEKFSELSFQYRNKKDSKRFPFINFFAYPIFCNLTPIIEAEYGKNKVEIVKVKPDNSFNLVESEYQFVPPFPVENAYLWAKCLTKMRVDMNKHIDARVLIGGRNEGFKGKYAGIVEEAHIALKTNKPTYLIGMFGGATLKIIEAITNKKNVIDSSFTHYNSLDYKSLKNCFAENNDEESPNIEDLNEYFKGLTWRDLKNGLSEDENKRLFITNHLLEVIYLVMKGLRNIYKSD